MDGLDGRIGAETFPIWDLDDNGFINSIEWDIGFANSRIFDGWDRNGDMYVEYPEWSVGLADWDEEDVGLWQTWDDNRDGRLDRYEFGDSVFVVWDEDENLRIDAGEFEVGRSAL